MTTKVSSALGAFPPPTFILSKRNPTKKELTDHAMQTAPTYLLNLGMYVCNRKRQTQGMIRKMMIMRRAPRHYAMAFAYLLTSLLT